jgi:asparaginyl-tRNA synthetase
MSEHDNSSSLDHATETFSLVAPQQTLWCYIDPETGNDDQSSDGSKARPFKSLVYAYIHNIDKPTPRYLARVQNATPGDADPVSNVLWKEPAKSAIKKAQGALDRHRAKQGKQQEAEAIKQQRREEALEAAASIKVVEDASLPVAMRIRLCDKDIDLGKRVRVCGRIHRLRVQKQATFITLTDGYGHLQCILEAGDLTKSRDALLFTQGTSLELFGNLKKVPPGNFAPGGRELLIDYYKVYICEPRAFPVTDQFTDLWTRSLRY